MKVKNSTYARAVELLYSKLPMFQRLGDKAYTGSLDNIGKLCLALGNPQQQIKTIHVGGTNGKGSSSHMLAAILQCAGYVTGLCTSPHLKDFTERIRIDGALVEEEFVVSFVDEIAGIIEEIKPSFFEITAAMAFAYFARCKVNFAVIEVGLGGRLDSTNIITPLAALVTHISYDHEFLLGSTLPAIAREKAGIVKLGVPVIIGQRQPEVQEVFLCAAQEAQAPICFASDRYRVRWPDNPSGSWEILRDDKLLHRLRPGLSGFYQAGNIAGVMAVVDVLRAQGVDIAATAVTRGIEQVKELTGLKGRWQKLGERPAVYCDVAHNLGGLEAVRRDIERQPYRRLHIVFGVSSDKPADVLLSALPAAASYYFCQARIARAMPADQLQQHAARLGLRGVAEPDVNVAIARARASADPEDLIFVGGSVFVVGEINNL